MILLCKTLPEKQEKTDFPEDLPEKKTSGKSHFPEGFGRLNIRNYYQKTSGKKDFRKIAFSGRCFLIISDI